MSDTCPLCLSVLSNLRSLAEQSNSIFVAFRSDLHSLQILRPTFTRDRLWCIDNHGCDFGNEAEGVRRSRREVVHFRAPQTYSAQFLTTLAFDNSPQMTTACKPRSSALDFYIAPGSDFAMLLGQHSTYYIPLLSNSLPCNFVSNYGFP